MGKILKNHTFRYYTMICNYLIINYMYNKKSYTHIMHRNIMRKCLIFSIIK